MHAMASGVKFGRKRKLSHNVFDASLPSAVTSNPAGDATCAIYAQLAMSDAKR
jgi:hypothetical protein